MPMTCKPIVKSVICDIAELLTIRAFYNLLEPKMKYIAEIFYIIVGVWMLALLLKIEDLDTKIILGSIIICVIIIRLFIVFHEFNFPKNEQYDYDDEPENKTKRSNDEKDKHTN
jgi:hypothetical protein